MTAFFWHPCDGTRHAFPGSWEQFHYVSLPIEATTLCGLKVTIASVHAEKIEWLWPTCVACYNLARRL